VSKKGHSRRRGKGEIENQDRQFGNRHGTPEKKKEKKDNFLFILKKKKGGGERKLHKRREGKNVGSNWPSHLRAFIVEKKREKKKSLLATGFTQWEEGEGDVKEGTPKNQKST